MTKIKKRDFSICEIFREWFTDNKHRFNEKCRIRYYKSREYKHVEIYFENVIREVRCWVNESFTLEIAAYHKGELIDFVDDLECSIHRGRDRKYYCGFCETPKYYKTPKELVIEHTFEEFLEWANEKFNTDHVLKLWYYAGRWRDGKIISKKKLLENPIQEKEQTGTNAVLIIPMIKGDGVPGMYGKTMSKAEVTAYRKQG